MSSLMALGQMQMTSNDPYTLLKWAAVMAGAAYFGANIYKSWREAWPRWLHMMPSEQAAAVRKFVAEVCPILLGIDICVRGATPVSDLITVACRQYACGDPMQLAESIVLVKPAWIAAVLAGSLISAEFGGWSGIKAFALSVLSAWVFTITIAFSLVRSVGSPDWIGIGLGLALAVGALILVAAAGDAAAEYREQFRSLEDAHRQMLKATKALEEKRAALIDLEMSMGSSWWTAEEEWWTEWRKEGIALQQLLASSDVSWKVTDGRSGFQGSSAESRSRRSDWERIGYRRKSNPEPSEDSQSIDIDPRQADVAGEYRSREHRLLSSAALELGLAEANEAKAAIELSWEKSKAGKRYAQKEIKKFEEWRRENDWKTHQAQVQQSHDAETARTDREAEARSVRIANKLVSPKWAGAVAAAWLRSERVARRIAYLALWLLLAWILSQVAKH